MALEAVIGFLASFGAERAWELVTWLEERRRSGTPRFERRVVDAFVDRHPDLLSRVECDRLRTWLHTTSWDQLLASADRSEAAPVVRSLAAAVFEREHGADEPVGVGERRRAAAVIGALWEALLTQLDRTDLLVLTSAARQEYQYSTLAELLGRIRDDLLELDATQGRARVSLEEIQYALTETVTEPVWPLLAPGKVVLRDPVSAAPSRLLRPRHAVIPFLFRDAERDRLLTWSAEGPPLAVAVVTGAAGAGKTRLAAEVCANLAQRAGANWRAGFLQPSTHTFGPGQRFERSASLCLVVDYAEARTADVLDVITAALDAPPTRLRVLLLMRNPASPQDPLNRLRFVREEIDEVLDGTPVVRLDGESWQQYQREVFIRTARDAFAAARGIPPPETGTGPAAGETPLELSIQALLGLLDDGPDTPDRNAAGGLEALLRHEERYWQSMAQGAGLLLSPETQRRCIALIALTGESIRSELDLVSALGLIPELHGSPSSELHDIARWLRWTYPGDLGAVYVSGLQPDLLSEYILAQAAFV